MAEYTETEIKAVVDELSMDAITKPKKEGVYKHGSLRCIIECYERGIEMHFVIDDGEGLAIGLEPAAFVSHNTFIGICLEVAELAP